MKPTIFTEEENILIKNTLNQRLKYLEKYDGRVAKDVKVIEEIFFDGKGH